MTDIPLLYNGPTSPFEEKCKVSALVLDVAHKEEKINIYKSRFLDEFNPLRQVPTLMLVIKRLQTVIIFVYTLIVFQKTLYIKDRYWESMTMISVSNGIMENVVNRYIEMSAIPN